LGGEAMKKYTLFGDALFAKVWQLYNYEFLHDETFEIFISHISEMFNLDDEEIEGLKLSFDMREYYK
jgi:hypothetical protein